MIFPARNLQLLRFPGQPWSFFFLLQLFDGVSFQPWGYADGPLFVRVSMAMDAIIADLVENLKDIDRS